MSVPPNYRLDLKTTVNKRYEDAIIHATEGKMFINRVGNTVECHICGKNRYAKKFPDKDNISPTK